MDTDAIRLKLAAALEAAVERAETNYAEWGKDDCVLWCANVLRDGAGVDPVPTIRGKYDSLAGAHKMIGKQGLAEGVYRAFIAQTPQSPCRVYTQIRLIAA